MQSRDEVETLTIRLPKVLKESVEELARSRSTTVTGIVKQALQESLQPPGRIYQQPGLTSALDEFLVKHGRGRVILLVVDDKSGERYFFEGRPDLNLTNESLVAIGRRNRTSWIIPRRDVVAWFAGVAGEQNQLAVSLMRQGWASRGDDL
jgi:predicted transcriptional regulator